MKRRTLDRYLSHCGVATREGARRLIESGDVEVNGLRITRADRWIEPDRDTVTLHGRRVVEPRGRVVAIYNKPRGLLVTMNDPEHRPTIYDALPESLSKLNLKAVGRLDRASAGLLLLTDDNSLASALLDKTHRVEKEYRLKVSPSPTTEQRVAWQRGVDIGDATPTAPAVVAVERENPKSAVLRITLVEGRNRQIRRMVESIGATVEWLVRIRFAGIELGELAVGDGRRLTAEEIDALIAATRG